MRRHCRVLVTTGLVTALVAGLVALGAGAGTASPATKANPPKAWAKQVCAALGDWHDTIEQAASGIASSSATNAKAVKKALGKLLTKAERATKALQQHLKKAGAPKVSGGAAIAVSVRDGYAQVGRSVGAARRAVAKATPSNPGSFLAAARAAEDALEAALESVQTAFNVATNLDAPALLTAFRAEPACAGLSG